jgi:prevent-host-death family protein
MRTITAMDLRRRLGQELDRASAGEHILVERDRRPLAVLVPYEDALRLQETAEEARSRALTALDRLDELAQRAASTDVPDVAAVISEERESGHGASA